MTQSPLSVSGILQMCSVKTEQTPVSLLLPSWNTANALQPQELLHLSHSSASAKVQQQQTTKPHLWLTMMVSHSFFLRTSLELLLWLKHYPDEWFQLLRGSMFICQPYSNMSGFWQSFVVHPGHCPWLQFHPQTPQSRFLRGNIADWSFNRPPSPVTSCSASSESWCMTRNYWTCWDLNLTVPLLLQGLIPPSSFPDLKGKPTIWRNTGQRWREHEHLIPGQKKWELLLGAT